MTVFLFDRYIYFLAAPPRSGRRKGISKVTTSPIRLATKLSQGKFYFRRTVFSLTAVVTAFVVFIPSSAKAEEEESEGGRLYATRQERRDAGISHSLTDWITVSGLLELEHSTQKFLLAEAVNDSVRNNSSEVLQLTGEFKPLSWFKTELVYEYEANGDIHTLDEAFISVEADELELEVGKLYLPFGEYYSHFVSGPILEFAESRVQGAVISYAHNERFDLKSFVYQGRAKKPNSVNESIDWGVAASGVPHENLRITFAYISDLADSNEALLADEQNRYQRRVSALTGSFVLGLDEIEISAEVVRPLSSFIELEPDRNAPFAWNLEAAFDVAESLEAALRVEGSDELEDEPKCQSGIAMTWRARPWATITGEYLLGLYRHDFAEDDNDRELRQVHTFGVQLSVAF